MSDKDCNELESIKLKGFIFDENNDGSLDSIIDYKENAEGRLEEVSVDFDNDGKADAKIYFEYDASGRISKKSVDKNMSGNINYIQTYEYNENGTYSVHYDDNADGKTDFIETFDSSGNAKMEDVRSKSQKIKDSLKDIFIPNKFKKKFEK